MKTATQSNRDLVSNAAADSLYFQPRKKTNCPDRLSEMCVIVCCCGENTKKNEI